MSFLTSLPEVRRQDLRWVRFQQGEQEAAGAGVAPRPPTAEAGQAGREGQLELEVPSEAVAGQGEPEAPPEEPVAPGEVVGELLQAETALAAAVVD